MTTIPKDFNPTIPARGTKEWREYCADICLWDGPVAARYSNELNWLCLDYVVPYNFFHCDYAKLPKPQPKKRRWYTRDEIMLLVPECLFLARLANRKICTANWYVSETECFMTGNSFVIKSSNFQGTHRSLDGGITWIENGVEE